MQVELPEPQAEILRQYCHEAHISESEAIRQAVTQFLSQKKPLHRMSDHAGFGSWNKKKQEGLSYQKQLRDEWSE